MRIVVGSDHAGFVLERHLRRLAKMKAIEARYQQSPAGVRRSLP